MSSCGRLEWTIYNREEQKNTIRSVAPLRHLIWGSIYDGLLHVSRGPHSFDAICVTKSLSPPARSPSYTHSLALAVLICANTSGQSMLSRITNISLLDGSLSIDRASNGVHTYTSHIVHNICQIKAENRKQNHHTSPVCVYASNIYIYSLLLLVVVGLLTECEC